MSDVVNLRRARKAKARAEKAADAGANRTRNARTKGEKAADVARETKAKAYLAGHKRERDAPKN